MTLATIAATAAAAVAAPVPASACSLVLSEHRSGAELQVLQLDAQQPEMRIAFEHSVLGTTVVDRYRFTPAPRLLEERFEGEGYGLPHVAGPGEQLQRQGKGWRLTTDRDVNPLVVRPLPQQRMRLLIGQRQWLLADFGATAIHFTARGCPAAAL